ncbi:peptidoglycan-binding protein [Arthrobacter sulfonylureivorans]|uniref:N-acetylmuramoyl-L-alanine amidase n=1 Tax=Arthrobacter sulfonylureivorans TaxID=2486855 RepID=UPI0039E39D29
MDNDATDQSLRRSDISRRVVALREGLLRAGVSMAYLAPDQVNNPMVFDDHVDAAVRTFQQGRGLMVDGIAGPETERALAEAQFKLGARPLAYSVEGPALRGDDVTELQRQLSFLGFYYGHIDGEYGERTYLAVRELQLNLGLEASGVVNEQLLASMERINRTISPSQAFSLRDYERLSQASATLRGRTITIAPGSGIDAPTDIVDSSTSKPLTEQLVAGDVSQRVGKILSELGASVEIIEKPPVDGSDVRADLIKASSPSLSIAIHCDWLPQPAANGVSAFFWGRPESGEVRSPIGHRAAELILKEIVARTGSTSLGLHGRSWDILRLPSTPSVQLDIGYLSSPVDAARLADPIYRQILADSIVIAIQRLYLLEEDDEPTGTLALDDVLRFNPPT